MHLFVVNWRPKVICISRILNAVIFFALSATNFGQLNGLGMTAVMMSCLLFNCKSFFFAISKNRKIQLKYHFFLLLAAVDLLD
jgi:hypothetical protein